MDNIQNIALILSDKTSLWAPNDSSLYQVGKQAEDNDELSIKPEHRDGADWWMQ
jgi:hypothetical protein